MDKTALLGVLPQGTPSYVFDLDKFNERAEFVKNGLGDIPLCYSIKANPFLIGYIPECISKVEVCSPGELEICMANKIPPESIIYSGVNKGPVDVEAALSYGVKIITAESIRHAQLINAASGKLGIVADTILRISSKNQFGMDLSDIESILSSGDYPYINFVGFHYYSGTQKKKTDAIIADIDAFESAVTGLCKRYSLEPKLVEYGPGAAVEYFKENGEDIDRELFLSICDRLRQFATRFPLSIEMGRFLASACGYYLTSVADIKTTDNTNFVICDGGINQLKYYGQTMAMQVPPITVPTSDSTQTDDYTLCGSLCTTADLLVRKASLPKLKLGDVLCFERCGAYSVTEGIGLFLSRELPQIFVYSTANGLIKLRDFYHTSHLNLSREI